MSFYKEVYHDVKWSKEIKNENVRAINSKCYQHNVIREVRSLTLFSYQIDVNIDTLLKTMSKKPVKTSNFCQIKCGLSIHILWKVLSISSWLPFESCALIGLKKHGTSENRIHTARMILSCESKKCNMFLFF